MKVLTLNNLKTSCLILSFLYVVFLHQNVNAQSGTAQDPFTDLSQVTTTISAGQYHFNLNGNTFLTSVSDGYVLIANDIGAPTSQDLAEVTSLDVTVRGILSTSALSNLGDFYEVKIRSSDGAIDVNTTNTTIISRIKAGETIHQGQADNAINDSWAGTSEANIKEDATCTTTFGTSLKGNIVHVCGPTTSTTWIPKIGVRRIADGSGNVADDVSFGLWINATLIAGLSGGNLWLKADAGTSTTTPNANVSSWLDQASSKSFTQATGNQQPVYLSAANNFNPALRFDGTSTDTDNDWLSYTGLMYDPNTAHTLFMVNFRNTSGNVMASIDNSIGQGRYLSVTGNYNENQHYTGVDGGPAINNVTMLNSVTMNGSLSVSTYRNGVLQNSGTVNTVSSLVTSYIGGSEAGGHGMEGGNMSEFVFYQSLLSADDQNKVLSYLAIKYGVSLGNNTDAIAYTNSAGTTIWNSDATYKYDIFGIGKDDGTGLNQTQSNSMNTGSGDGTGQSGKGNIVLSNPSSLGNGDFLLIGHNNAGLTEQITEVPTSGQRRLAREWLVKRTNDPGTVDLSFDIIGLSLSGTAAADFKLLIDADGDFSSGATEVNAASLTGTKVQFTSVSIPDGSYLTIVVKFATLVGPGVVGANLWLKTNDGVSNSGSDLTGWVDKAGINTFSKQGTIDYSTNVINFNPSAKFTNPENSTNLPVNRLDGNTDILYVDGFAVYKSNRIKSALIGGVTPGTNYGQGIFLSYGSSNVVGAGSGSYLAHSQFNNPNLSSFNIANLDVSLSTTPFATGRLNGLSQTVTHSGGTAFNSLNIKPMIGGTNNIGNESGWFAFDGEVAEIILYSFSLTPLEKLKVESYLAIKYGITLDPSITNYVSSSGTVIWNNATYWNDVFGIGKDDASGLNQTSSNSINTGSGDGTGQSGKGNIVLSSASSFDDGDFLMIGHDNSALSAQYTDLPTSVKQARIAREWKADRTGDVGTVNLNFELNGISLPGTIGTATTDFNILIDSDGDGDFSDATATNPSTVNGTLLTFNGLTIPDGAVFSFSFQLTKTWDGSESTVWATGDNWAQNSTPEANGYDHVVIADVASDPIIPNNGQISVKNLTLAANATLTIASDATGTGSLKIDGTLTNNGGTITSQHYLEGAAQAWHMIGAPVSGSIATNGWNPTAGQDDFYAWDEPSPGTWVNYDNTGSPSFTTVNGGMDFVPGKGYLVAYNSENPTKSFVGTLSTGNVNFPLKRSGAKAWTYFTGWNLMANPYSSAIDWNLATRTQFEDNFAYAYDPNKSGGEGYVNIDGSQANAFIAPHQAFFVRATQAANNTNFSFTNAIQSHGGSNYKSGNSVSGIVLRLASGDFYDETTIRLMDQSTANRDRNDAVKMYSFNPAVPQLYSLSDDGASLAVNSMNRIIAENPIAMGFKAGNDASYTLSLVQNDAQLAANGLFVEDKSLGIIHRIDQSAYSFSAEQGEVTDRFVLHFGMVGLDEPAAQAPAQLWFAGEQLYLQSSEAFQQIELFDLQGRSIFSSGLGHAPLQTISINKLQNGLYIVRLKGENATFSSKVKFIR